MPKRIIRLIWILIFLPPTLSSQVLTFTPTQMRADLETMNRYLRKWHPSYYTYTPDTEMNAFYEMLSDSCYDTLTLNQFRTRLRQAVNKVGCGHMNVSNPDTYDPAVLPELIPLDVWITGEQLYVRKYRGEGGFLNPGDEILSINGVSAAEILERTEELVFTDGYNTTHKIYGVEQVFPIYYYYVFGPTAGFQIERKSTTGETAKVEFAPVPQTNKPELNPGNPVDSTRILIQGNGLALYSMDSVMNAALIDIDKFLGKKHRQSYRQMFRYLRLNDIDHLVVDLRNNGGGGVFKGNNFLAYMLKPWIRGLNISRQPNLTMFNPKFKNNFMSRITPLLFMLNPLEYPGKGGWHHFFPFFRKGRNHFNGRIYVLANGGTFSMASYTTNHLKHKRGAFVIGEETGGGEAGSRGMVSGDIILPNTGLKISLNVFQVRHNLKIEDSGHGVMPDYPVTYSIEDRLQQKDLEMELVRKLIQNDRKLLQTAESNN
jgi:hypothetical protein